MGKKRSKFTPSNFENVGKSTLSATLYASMLQSNAWYQLTPQAQRLYLYMKLQKYGQKPLEGYPTDTFVFNRAMYTKTYPLYKTWGQFDRDCRQLIEWGFIRVVENGRFTRTKNVYQFSADWQNR